MLKFVGFLVFVSVSYAAVARFSTEEKPVDLANQEGCYISKINRVLPYDVNFYPNTDCAVYICQSSNNETLYETCGAIAISDGCRRSAIDNSKQYPDCCYKEVCDSTTTTPAPDTTNEGSNQGSSSSQSPIPQNLTLKRRRLPLLNQYN
ncbi:uncharacterized protein LOC133524832 [Cydia pomonella]|uniref:uncharacterized protein LOC133524832 n=1 Tax=Cydia pomonella TaxID=82600 RepID=UPI002ADD6079|nr:uncharacterized protein LOC133524832 [Cydia pomonella]